MNKFNIDVEFPEFKGIDYEPEDRDVGIMGASWSLCFKASGKQGEKQVSIILDDDQMAKLKKEVMKYNFEGDID